MQTGLEGVGARDIFHQENGANPSLTITAIAMCTADRIKAVAARGEL